MRAVRVPTREQLAKAYESLLWSRRRSLGDLVTFAQWARLDPRLAEIVVQVIADNFARINPFKLWKLNRKAPCPQALLVLTEFARLRFHKGSSARHFRIWQSMLTTEIPPAHHQLFFLSGTRPRPDREIETVKRSLSAYRKWGFFGDVQLNQRMPTIKTLMSREARQYVLDQLIDSGQPFSVSDYIRACGGQIQRRTAERDLEACDAIKAHGLTRARSYRVR